MDIKTRDTLYKLRQILLRFYCMLLSSSAKYAYWARPLRKSLDFSGNQPFEKYVTL